jgi:uncharacterized membrane protein YedE/YeeE
MSFEIWPPVIGGALIGAAATLFVVLNGRVAGISGIVGGLLARPSADTAWRAAFVVGLIVAPIVYGAAGGLSAFQIQASTPMLVAGGLLVGIGTSLGSGCTSGHGVCGLARLSPRSMVATGVFMAAGIVTVFVVRHLIAA